MRRNRPYLCHIIVESMWIFQEPHHKATLLKSFTSSFLTIFFACGLLAAQNAPVVYDGTNFLSNVPLRANSLAIGDLNADRFDDLVIGQNAQQPIVYFWSASEGKFFPDSSANISTRPLGSAYGPFAVLDINGDDKNDVLISYLTGDTTVVATYVDGTFINTARPAGILTFENSLRSHHQFADYNKDGLLDYVVGRNIAGRLPSNYLVYNVLARGGQPARLDGSSELSQQFATNISNYISDFDNDNVVDFFRINYSGEKSRMFKGGLNGFTTIFESNVSVSAFGYGALVFDYDLDGLPDIYRTIAAGSNLGNLFYRNTGGFQFDQPDVGAATLEKKSSYNAHAGDIDNDGDLDILVAEKNAACSFYENEFMQGNARFSKKNLDLFPQVSDWVFAIFTDFDDNGKLDILTAANGGTINSRFYTNAASNSNNWLKVNLTSSNALYREAFGAKLLLKSSIGGVLRTQLREVTPSNGYHVFYSTVQHFGLGSGSNGAELLIQWPSGYVQTLTIPKSGLNKVLEIVEPEAGKLALSNGPNLQAPSGSTASAKLSIQNTGKQPVQITDIESAAPGVRIFPASFLLQSGNSAAVTMEYTAAEAHGFETVSHALTVRSDALIDSIRVSFSTRNLGIQTPFTAASGDSPFFTGGDFHNAGAAADFFPKATGSIDLVSVNDFSEIRLFSATGGSLFKNRSFSPSGLVGDGPKSFSIGDIDYDGRLDLTMAQRTDALVIFRNADSSFTGERFTRAASANHHQFKMIDLNGDTKLELLILNAGNQRSEVLYDVGGSYLNLDARDLTDVPMDIRASALADITGDSLPDLVVCDATRPSSPVRLLKNIGNSQFQDVALPTSLEVTGVFNAIVIFDSDNDRLADIFLGSGDGKTSSMLLKQSVNGTFSSVQSTVIDALPTSVSDAAAVDIDLDSFQDLVITYDQFLVNNTMLLNIDGSRFLRLTSGDAAAHEPFSTASLVVTDVDFDTRPDLWYINSDFSNALFLNNTAESRGSFAVRPYKIYPNGNRAPVPGTVVTCTATIGGREVTQTRVLGFGTQHSVDLTAAFFGMGSASTAFVEAVFPDGTTVSASVPVNRQYVDLESAYVAAEPDLPLPEKIQLYSYPNPFNPASTVALTIPETAPVELSVFSISGQKIASLHRGMLSKGTHLFTIDGSRMSSGVYLLTFTSGSTRMVKKLTLLK